MLWRLKEENVVIKREWLIVLNVIEKLGKIKVESFRYIEIFDDDSESFFGSLIKVKIISE